MSSDEEYEQRINTSSPSRKATKTSAEASPSSTISSLSQSPYKHPLGQPRANGNIFNIPVNTNNMSMILSTIPLLTPANLDILQEQIIQIRKHNISQTSSAQTSSAQTSSADDLNNTFDIEQQHQSSHELIDFLNGKQEDSQTTDYSNMSVNSDNIKTLKERIIKLKTELNESKTELNESKTELDKKFNEITKIAESTEELTQYKDEDVINIGGFLFKKIQEEEELNDIKTQIEIDESDVNNTENNMNTACSQLENEDSQMTTESCNSTYTMMENTITAIYKKSANRKLEQDKRQSAVKAILAERYEDIDFDKIRKVVEEGKSTNEQMSRIWGDYIEGETYKNDYCCYLCGGKLVNIEQGFTDPTDINSYHRGLKPEIEHKLPAIEFYSKVHNIINREEYTDLFDKWKLFVNNSDNNTILLEAYTLINCTETDEARMNTALDDLCNSFKEKNSEDPNIAKFICLIKINLIEFAYSHHTCNQVKSNNNLRKSANIYTESINTYLLEVKNVINKNNVTDSGKKQIVGLIKDYKLWSEKTIILDSIGNSNNKLRIESNMRLINSLIDDYTKLCNISSTRMIAESIRDIIIKYRNDKEGKSISAEKKRFQDKLKMNSTEITKIRNKFETYIGQIDKPPGRSSRADPKQHYETLYNENNIEDKNELIKKMNDIERDTYPDFDKYVTYYNDNIKKKSNFSGLFGEPKSATGGKKSRRLRLKSNRKTKKKRRNSKK